MKLIQKNCHVANINLAKSSLVIHSFGNISSRIDDKFKNDNLIKSQI